MAGAIIHHNILRGRVEISAADATMLRELRAKAKTPQGDGTVLAALVPGHGDADVVGHRIEGRGVGGDVLRGAAVPDIGVRGADLSAARAFAAGLVSVLAA